MRWDCFLGYPVEDVRGFIEHQGRDYLCTGYWKVYENLEQKQQLFQRFEYAKENLVLLFPTEWEWRILWISSAGPDKRRCIRNVQVRSDGEDTEEDSVSVFVSWKFFLPHILRRNWRRLDK